MAEKFKEGTVAWKILHGDWSNYTMQEIADQLHVTRNSVGSAIYRLQSMGYDIKVKRSTRGRSRKGEGKFKKGTLAWSLMNDDWSDLTISQIAEVLGVSRTTIDTVLYRLRSEGITIAYQEDKRGRKEEV